MKPTKAAIIFASLTGNNAEIADFICEQLKVRKITVVLKEISQSDAFKLKNFDLVIIVLYTYAQGDLPPESLDFFDDLVSLTLKGVSFAAIGSGDHWYGNFCQAVLTFDQQFEKCQANRAAFPLLIEDRMTQIDQKKINSWLDQLFNNIKY